MGRYAVVAIWLCMLGLQAIERAEKSESGNMDEDSRSPAVAASAPSPVEISVGHGWSGGEVGFLVGAEGVVVSEVQYDLDGTVFEICADAALLTGPDWAVLARGRYLSDIQVGGDNTDRDWDEVGRLSDSSVSDESAAVSVWSADLALQIRAAPAESGWWAGRPFAVGLHAGYGSHGYRFDVDDLWGIYDYGATPVRYVGPVAKYDVTFTSARIGGNAGAYLSRNLYVGAEYTYMPNLEAESEAYWILRDYRFEQTARGVGEELRVTAQYRVHPNAFIFARYRSVVIDADEDGLENGAVGNYVYHAQPIVPEITADYKVTEVGIGGRF